MILNCRKRRETACECVLSVRLQKESSFRDAVERLARQFSQIKRKVKKLRQLLQRDQRSHRLKRSLQAIEIVVWNGNLVMWPLRLVLWGVEQ